MTIRRRLSLAAAVAVALAVVLAAGSCYVAVRAKLRSEVETSLRRTAAAIEVLPPSGAERFRLRAPPDAPPRPSAALRRILVRGFGRSPGEFQILGRSGDVTFRDPEGERLPVDLAARQIATGKQGRILVDRDLGGDHVRLLVAPLKEGGAVQVARSLEEVDSVLRALLLILIAIAVAGVGIAAVLGGLVSRAALRPVRRFTERTESIAGTPDLTQRLTVERDDELGRLAASFNTTLDELERSVAAQRQLVADASHELRTPLASLRTNLEVISSDRRLPDAERRELLRDLIEQAEELNLLVGDVVELARRGEPDEAMDDVALADLVAAAARRAQRHRPDVRFALDLQPTTVMAVAQRLDRAVANLLDNAGKWSPPGAAVEVTLHDGSLTVRDHGPGIDPGELRFVFDRFHRATSARGMPGSGLGLAIIRQVAEAHGAEVRAANAPGGGAVFTLRFPDAAPGASSSALTEIFGSAHNSSV